MPRTTRSRLKAARHPSEKRQLDLALQDGGSHGAFTWGVLDRISEVTFNASLVKEIHSITLLHQMIADEGRPGHHYRNPLFQRVDALRVHLIDGGASLAPLGPTSKSNTQWAFLQQLHSLGHSAAEQWLAAHAQDLGQRSSWDLHQVLAP